MLYSFIHVTFWVVATWVYIFVKTENYIRFEHSALCKLHLMKQWENEFLLRYKGLPKIKGKCESGGSQSPDSFDLRIIKYVNYSHL